MAEQVGAVSMSSSGAGQQQQQQHSDAPWRRLLQSDEEIVQV
jgi:hypothetical protein